MWRPTIANCLIWALWMLLRRGGGIKAYRSHYGWWPHFLWESETGETYEYVPPTRVQLHGWQQVVPLRILLFRGVVKLAGRYEEVG